MIEAMATFYAEHTGTSVAIRRLDALRARPDVLRLKLDLEPGAQVRAPSCCLNRAAKCAADTPAAQCRSVKISERRAEIIDEQRMLDRRPHQRRQRERRFWQG